MIGLLESVVENFEVVSFDESHVIVEDAVFKREFGPFFVSELVPTLQLVWDEDSKKLLLQEVDDENVGREIEIELWPVGTHSRLEIRDQGVGHSY